MSQVVLAPCSHVNYFHVQLQPIGLLVIFAPLLRTPSPIMQSSSDTLFLLGSRKRLNPTEHRTEHFLMGGTNCYITYQTHEFLFLFPVGGSTIVTVARLLFFCPRALLNEEHRTAKWWLRYAPLYTRKLQGNYSFGSYSWLSP